VKLIQTYTDPNARNAKEIEVDRFLSYPPFKRCTQEIINAYLTKTKINIEHCFPDNYVMTSVKPCESSTRSEPFPVGNPDIKMKKDYGMDFIKDGHTKKVRNGFSKRTPDVSSGSMKQKSKKIKKLENGKFQSLHSVFYSVSKLFELKHPENKSSICSVAGRLTKEQFILAGMPENALSELLKASFEQPDYDNETIKKRANNRKKRKRQSSGNGSACDDGGYDDYDYDDHNDYAHEVSSKRKKLPQGYRPMNLYDGGDVTGIDTTTGQQTVQSLLTTKSSHRHRHLDPSIQKYGGTMMDDRENSNDHHSGIYEMMFYNKMKHSNCPYEVDEEDSNGHVSLMTNKITDSNSDGDILNFMQISRSNDFEMMNEEREHVENILEKEHNINMMNYKMKKEEQLIPNPIFGRMAHRNGSSMCSGDPRKMMKNIKKEDIENESSKYQSHAGAFIGKNIADSSRVNSFFGSTSSVCNEINIKQIQFMNESTNNVEKICQVQFNEKLFFCSMDIFNEVSYIMDDHYKKIQIGI